MSGRDVAWARTLALALALALAPVAALLAPGVAHAFKIGTSFSPYCHERITLHAFHDNKPLKGLNVPPRDAPDDAAWVRLAQHLEDQVGVDLDDDFQRLVLLTLFVGVRYPDGAGHDMLDVTALRDVHLAEEGQDAHALRGVEHDGRAEADREAIEAIKTYILEAVDEARDELLQGTAPGSGLQGQTEDVEYWLEFYGPARLRVWSPLFTLGRAVHALQDSFPHTYRSADTSRIYAVANFVEAADRRYDEDVQGPRHSGFLDTCTESEIAPLEAAATQATADLFGAFAAYARTDDRSAVEAVLDRHLTYEEGCTADNDWCDTPWAPLARREETAALCACRLGAGTAAPLPTPPDAALALLLLGLLAIRHGRREER